MARPGMGDDDGVCRLSVPSSPMSMITMQLDGGEGYGGVGVGGGACWLMVRVAGTAGHATSHATSH